MKKQEIINSIVNNTNDYYSYAHFAAANMADYTLMSSTIKELAAVYPISQFEAAEVVEALTHVKK